MKYSITKNIIEFEIEREEDLYVLYLIIDKEDLLYGWTVREFKTRKHEKGERKRIYICLKVETLEYHAFRGSLRVRGIILEAPEWFDGIIGSHHTMELIRGVKYRLVKQSVDVEYIKRILELFSKSHARALIVSINEDEATIAIAKVFGIEILTTIFNKYLTGKQAALDRRKQFEKYVEDVIKIVKSILKPEEVNYIVVVAPPRVLDYIQDILRENLRDLGRPCKISQVSEGGLAGIYEIQNTNPEILEDVLRLHELKLVDEVFERLVKGRLDVAIGTEEVLRAIERGAVDTLLILDEHFKEYGLEIKTLISNLIKTGGKLVLIPSFTNAGEKLRGLGGIAALLRYEISE